MSVRVLQGHVLDVLAALPEKHVSVCVTSPPYWQLRAYGTEPQVWQAEDGDALCAPEQHEWHALPEHTAQTGGVSEKQQTHRGNPGTGFPVRSAFCAHCHAWRGEYGQEPTPELYLWHTVLWARAVRRVLRDDGTLFVNLAGCYWSDPGGQNGANLRNGMGASTLTGSNLKNKAVSAISAKAIEANRQNGRKQKGRHPVYKPLDYVDIPGLVARALQADGWLWRSDVALVKVAPMPESVQGTRWERCKGEKLKAGATKPGYGGATKLADPTAQYDVGRAPLAEWQDCPGCPRCSANEGLVLRRGSGRPTRAWERLLVFAKKAGYWWDVEALREPVQPHRHDPRSAVVPDQSERPLSNLQENGRGGVYHPSGGRNARDWFLWRPEPLRDEHYAAFPSSIPSFAIRAGSSERGCCPACGAPWARVVERRPSTRVDTSDEPGRRGALDGWRLTDDPTKGNVGLPKGSELDGESTTLGWRPTCSCPPHTPCPAVVLDVFGGSGTTGIAADRLGRDAILIELKPAYARLAERRLNRDAPLLMWGAVSLEGAGETEDAPLAHEPAPGGKQASHPNRTVQGFNERWAAKQKSLEDAAG